MVKLRLRRKGRRHHPVYDIVAVDGRKRRDGAFLEIVGFYDPNSTPSEVRFKADRCIYWLNVGAQPTEVVNKLMSAKGVLLRRHLEFKGTAEEQINEMVEKHATNAEARYIRRKENRKARIAAKKKAEKEAENADA